jgi:hypothetical protein
MSRFMPTLTGGPTTVLVDSPIQMNTHLTSPTMVTSSVTESSNIELFDQKSTKVQTSSPAKQGSSMSMYLLFLVCFIVILISWYWSDLKQSIYRYFFPKGPFLYL